MTRADLDTLVAARVITPREAEAIHLHDTKGMSYRQIALGLDVTVSVVYDRVKRGHQKIKRARQEAA
jgi:DNA-directed RNA polymerase specialized sigma24 family protein